MEPIVSIIVPVYNAETTLPRCVESILNQEYPDIELLLVDDGSRDGSGALCDAYAARDSRVRVIHRANAGVSAARNAALDRARGTYLQFLDSDDWITPNATRLLVRTAEERHCDLVISDFYRVVGERVSHKGDIDDDGLLTREEYAAHMMENPADFYYGVLWNKLYRRRIVEAHHLRMDPEISWCEDFMFNLEYIRHAGTFCALPVPIYYYVKTKGSLANQNLSISKTVKMKLTVFEYYNRFYKSVFDEAEYEKSRLKVYKFLFDAAQDGAVPPSILPGSKRLGDERIQVCADVLSGEGPLYDAFRDRKLMDYYLEPAALKNDLTLADARLLLCLSALDTAVTRKTLADFAGVSRRALAMGLQRLSSRELLRVEELWSGDEGQRKVRIRFSPAAESVLDDLAEVQRDYQEARLAGFTDQERAVFGALLSKVRENIREVL